MLNYSKSYAFLMDNHSCRQAEIAAKAIGRLEFPRQREFQLIDVGSHDGKLTGLVHDELKKHHGHIATHCIEPDEITYLELLGAFSKKGGFLFDNKDYQSWIREFGFLYYQSADLVLNSHTTDHYPEEFWLELIHDTNSMLKGHGKHVFFLDAGGAAWDEIKKVADERIPNRGTNAVGNWLKSYHFTDFLESEGIEHTTIKHYSPVFFPDDISAFGRVCLMLGFLMRYEMEDIEKHIPDEVEELMDKHRQGRRIVFPRNQEMIVVPEQKIDFSNNEE
ncbi:MAG: hypothetical protein QF632_02720 [Candidatus Woesearchaeota archaeon]|jgi:hypothetical protein|nr:hypothetical protein [Candidatus Woesearchaeota archaeon]MDP7323649.1 hypothetical protein [Candidatus Woesearchaeota archaeon]MDP7457740.1 hypothetical protein [Candidatus Woesearchaeota archaeon]